jgi:hypothetical protein
MSNTWALLPCATSDIEWLWSIDEKNEFIDILNLQMEILNDIAWNFNGVQTHWIEFELNSTIEWTWIIL